MRGLLRGSGPGNRNRPPPHPLTGLKALQGAGEANAALRRGGCRRSLGWRGFACLLNATRGTPYSTSFLVTRRRFARPRGACGLPQGEREGVAPSLVAREAFRRAMARLQGLDFSQNPAMMDFNPDDGKEYPVFRAKERLPMAERRPRKGRWAEGRPRGKEAKGSPCVTPFGSRPL
jgi:hypothetical protein